MSQQVDYILKLYCNTVHQEKCLQFNTNGMLVYIVSCTDVYLQLVSFTFHRLEATDLETSYTQNTCTKRVIETPVVIQ